MAEHNGELRRSPSEENLLTPMEQAAADHNDITFVLPTHGRRGHDEIETIEREEMQNSDEFEAENLTIPMSNGGNARPCLSITITDSEHAIKIAGGFGLYQIFYVLALQLFCVLASGNYSFMQYSTSAPNISCLINNFTIEYQVHRHEFCQFYEAHQCNATIWHDGFYTITEQWELICSRDHIPETINSVQTIGVILTAPFFGLLSDHFGRRRVVIVAMTTMCVANIVSTISPSWILFTAARLLSATAMYASTAVTFIWGMETFDARNNIIANLSASWSLGFIITAGLAAASHGWRSLLTALNVLTLPTIVIFNRFVESPRWLVQNGNLEAAAQALNKIAITNRPHTPVVFTAANLRNIVRDTHEETMGQALRVLLTHPRLSFHLFIQGMLTFAAASCAQGFFYQMAFISSSPYTSVAMMGFVRLTLMPLAYLLDRKLPDCGRRVPLAIITLSQMLDTAIKFLPFGGTSVDKSAEFYTMLISTVTTMFLWVGLGQYAVELFPTPVRNTAGSIAYIFDPLAGVLAPQMIYLEEHLWRPIQSVYLSMLCVLVFIAAYLFLPETKGQPLPATVEETAHNTAPPPATEGITEARFIIRTGWRTLRHRLTGLCREGDEVGYTQLRNDESSADECCGAEDSDDDERNLVGDIDHWQDDSAIPPSPPDLAHRII